MPYLTVRLLRGQWQPARRLAHSHLSRAFDTAPDDRADVTELEGVDRERRESERRFRAIFDRSLPGQVLRDDLGVCLDVNNTALAIVDARRDDGVGGACARAPACAAPECAGAGGPDLPA